MKGNIATGAKITTDQWTSYGPLAKTFKNLAQIPSGKKGSNFPKLHHAVMNLKG